MQIFLLACGLLFNFLDSVQRAKVLNFDESNFFPYGSAFCVLRNLSHPRLQIFSPRSFMARALTFRSRIHPVIFLCDGEMGVEVLFYLFPQIDVQFQCICWMSIFWPFYPLCASFQMVHISGVQVH